MVAGLKHIIKVCNITTFAISTVGADGQRLYSIENAKSAGGISKLPIEAQLSTKIQILLD